jgi:hypothetical protein
VPRSVKTRWKGHHEPELWRYVLSAYKSQARRRNLIFDLSEESFYLLLQQNCHYCGRPPSNIQKLGDRYFLYTGVDRRDSSQGYYDTNVVPCCRTCNLMKGQLHYDQFAEAVFKISGHLTNFKF